LTAGQFQMILDGIDLSKVRRFNASRHRAEAPVLCSCAGVL